MKRRPAFVSARSLLTTFRTSTWESSQARRRSGWSGRRGSTGFLGFLNKDQHLRDTWRSLSSSIAGFYSWERILWVVTEDWGMDPEDFSPYERETIVHEMIHALQDYHFDLASTYRNVGWNLDLHLGFRAVIEGGRVDQRAAHLHEAVSGHEPGA